MRAQPLINLMEINVKSSTCAFFYKLKIFWDKKHHEFNLHAFSSELLLFQGVRGILNYMKQFRRRLRFVNNFCSEINLFQFQLIKQSSGGLWGLWRRFFGDSLSCALHFKSLNVCVVLCCLHTLLFFTWRMYSNSHIQDFSAILRCTWQ